MKRLFTIGILLTVALSASAFGAAPFLWQIRRDGHSSYILGTDHGIGSRQLPESVWRHFAQADLFVFETLGAEAAEAEIGELSVGRSPLLFQPPGQTLSQSLGKDLVKRIQRVLPTGDVETLTPRGLFLILSPTLIDDPIRVKIEKETYLTLSESDRGLLKSSQGYMDEELRQKARALGRELVQIESSRSEFATPIHKSFFVRLLNAFQREKDESLARRNAIRRWQTMVSGRRSYLEGDLEASRQHAQVTSNDPLAHGLPQEIRDRHVNWPEPIIEAHRRGSAFISVGIGHLLDAKSGLLVLLKARGFEVTRVKSCGEELEAMGVE